MPYIVAFCILLCVLTGLKKILFPDGIVSQLIFCLITIAIGAVLINFIIPLAFFISIAKLCAVLAVILIIINAVIYFIG